VPRDSRVDLAPRAVAFAQAKSADLGLRAEVVFCADARNLAAPPAGAFDGALLMGPPPPHRRRCWPCLNETVRTDPAAYVNALCLAEETCELPPYPDSTEHLHAVAGRAIPESYSPPS